MLRQLKLILMAVEDRSSQETQFKHVSESASVYSFKVELDEHCSAAVIASRRRQTKLKA